MKSLTWMVRLPLALTVIVACHSASAWEPGCNLSVDNICVPKRTSYGYYETNWRRWPAGGSPTHATPRMGTSDHLPIVETPKTTEEGEVRPSSPRAGYTPPATLPGYESPMNVQPSASPATPAEPISTNSPIEWPSTPQYSPVLFQSGQSSQRGTPSNAVVSGALKAGSTSASTGKRAIPAALASQPTAANVPSDDDLFATVETANPNRTATETMDWETGPASHVPLVNASRMRELVPPPQIRSNRRDRQQPETIQPVSATQPVTSTTANPLRISEETTTPINPLR